tara:strand:- start:794 stop:1024 length:231 start_codon:yes stop_codon:yes gene_type:complete
MSELDIKEQIDSLEEVTQPSTNSEFYTNLRVMLESMESDVLKSEKGNKAAATRLRKSLRLLKSTSADFVKFTLGKL